MRQWLRRKYNALSGTWQLRILFFGFWALSCTLIWVGLFIILPLLVGNDLQLRKG